MDGGGREVSGLAAEDVESANDPAEQLAPLFRLKQNRPLVGAGKRTACVRGRSRVCYFRVSMFSGIPNYP